MAKCLVTLPITGIVCVEVEADTEQEALKKAKDECSFDDIEEFDCYTNEITTPDGNTLMASVEIDLKS